ncbi:hypothetical protein BDL97_02G049500 [Sphagnum fallax]|nr:hypothetical protein BDL97_02G049500 [Sphagnum fallax]
MMARRGKSFSTFLFFLAAIKNPVSCCTTSDPSPSANHWKKSANELATSQRRASSTTTGHCLETHQKMSGRTETQKERQKERLRQRDQEREKHAHIHTQTDVHVSSTETQLQNNFGSRWFD